jgi:hypothetical protein
LSLIFIIHIWFRETLDPTTCVGHTVVKVRLKSKQKEEKQRFFKIFPFESIKRAYSTLKLNVLIVLEVF